MGLWPFGKKRAPTVVPPRRKGGRPTREEAAERRKQKLLDIKTEIELMKLRKELAKLRTANDDGDASLPNLRLGDLDALKKLLRAAGYELKPIGASNPAGAAGIIHDVAILLEQAGPLMQQFGLVTPPGSTQGNPPPPAAPAPGRAAPSPTQHEALPPHAGGTIQPPQMTPLAALIASQIERLTPAQAADWLLAQEHPAFKQAVEAMRSASGEQLPALVGEFSAKMPALGGLSEWLQSRWEWTTAVVDELRQRDLTPTPTPGV